MNAFHPLIQIGGNQDIITVLEYRKIVEKGTIGLVVHKITPKDIEYLEGNLFNDDFVGRETRIRETSQCGSPVPLPVSRDIAESNNQEGIRNHQRYFVCRDG